ncbi:hypothetical protein GEOBRER4_n3081 [Citrifermentans bremense]|uniref:Uncharacterized protein n=1 Tax=Citrifermentans bremense TaxID=60035 RepID=A0A6S6M9K5_9BACT|nr:DUF6290 family protein [Citrifermentans bremense]BCG48201.1 hypothetical protein GEOBRER4_n3081 [Citrifermentans bremense]
MDYMESNDGRQRRHIISVRVSDEELEYLTRLLELHNTTMSELMRDALGSPALLRRRRGTRSRSSLRSP